MNLVMATKILDIQPIKLVVFVVVVQQLVDLFPVVMILTMQL